MLNGRFGGESKLLLFSKHYDLTTTSQDGQSTLCQKHVTFVSPAGLALKHRANCLENVTQRL
jgi:hypothetical protein